MKIVCSRYLRISISLVSDEKMKTIESKNNEMDVNDVFESILLSEERVSEEGYRKGFEIGVRDGNLEAYHLGNI